MDNNNTFFPDTDFDLDTVEVVESADLRIKDPTRNLAPTNIVFSLASPMHRARRSWEFAQQRKLAAAMQKTGRLNLGDPEEREAAELEKLVVCTLGWRGSKTPFSADAARKLYADPARLHIREQVKTALDDIELFTRLSVPS